MTRPAFGLRWNKAGSVSARFGLLQRRRLLSPRLELFMAPIRKIVHVFQELLPSHDTWRCVGGHEVWAAAAFRVGANFFAHVLANSSEFVLELRAAPQVFRSARFFSASVFHVKHCHGCGGQNRKITNFIDSFRLCTWGCGAGAVSRIHPAVAIRISAK